jgi:hypothetical protein
MLDQTLGCLTRNADTTRVLFASRPHELAALYPTVAAVAAAPRVRRVRVACIGPAAPRRRTRSWRRRAARAFVSIPAAMT